MKTIILLFAILLLQANFYAQTPLTVINGDFESSTNSIPDNWTANLGTLNNGDAFSGSNGALLTSSSGSPNSNILNSGNYSLKSGLPTYLTAWVKPTANLDRSALRLMQSDGITNLVGGQAVVWNKPEFINQWNKIMMVRYVPVSDIDTKIRIDNPIANDIINYDNVELIQNPLTVNGDMEVKFLANSATSPQTQIYQKNGINPFTRDSSISRSGNNSIKCTTVNANATFNQNPNYQHIIESNSMNYQGTFWVTIEPGAPSADFYAELWINGTKVGTGNSVTINPNDPWTKIETPTITSDPSGTGKIYAKLVCVNNGASRTIFFVDDYSISKENPSTLSSNNPTQKTQKLFFIDRTGIALKNNVEGNIIISDLSGKIITSTYLTKNKKMDFNFKRGQLYFITLNTNSVSKTEKIAFNF